MVQFKKFRPCRVCNSPGNGIHFGVDACRGCTAFFRRTVAQKKEYICNADESCNIGAITEGLVCRNCRFKKCLAVGMRREAVQTNRDIYGKRDRDNQEQLHHALVPSPSTYKFSFPVPIPVLKGIRNSYPQLESVRLVVHREEGSSMFIDRTPKRVTYKEANQVNLKEFYLVGDWISTSFSQFSDLPLDQKDILMRNFYLQFFILECGFMSCKQGHNDVWFLPNGDYIDCQNLETFYCDPEGCQEMTPQVAATLFSGSCQHYKRNVTTPMIQEKVNQFEFLALAALVLFDPGLEGQSEKCIEICRNIRSTVQREMIQYYQSTRECEESSLRMGSMLSILPSLQRATSRMHKDMELGHIFNTFPVETKFYENCLRRIQT